MEHTYTKTSAPSGSPPSMGSQARAAWQPLEEHQVLSGSPELIPQPDEGRITSSQDRTRWMRRKVGGASPWAPGSLPIGFFPDSRVSVPSPTLLLQRVGLTQLGLYPLPGRVKEGSFLTQCHVDY